MNNLQKKVFLCSIFGTVALSTLVGLVCLSVDESNAQTVTYVEAIPYKASNTNEVANIAVEVANEHITVEAVKQEILLESELLEDPNVVFCERADYNVPNEEKGCKSYKITYMPYTAVTYKPSDQYKLLNSEFCYTDEETGIRMIEDRYCIALGSGYTHDVGTKVNLVFEDGTILLCILGDCKADCHTDSTNRYHAVDGSVAEFIVDYEYFESTSQWDSIRPKGCKIVKVVVL